MVLTYCVSEENSGKDIKTYLKKQGISHRLLLSLKKNNCIFVNSSSVFTNHIIFTNDIVTLDLNYAEESNNIVPVAMPLSIIYEDDSLFILNKPAGIPVHPSLNNYKNSLSNGVKYYFNKIGLNKKIRPVNRLDKDTTGLVVFAKNEYIQENLIQQMSSKKFEKEYLALLEGKLLVKSGSICAPIARKEDSIIERIVAQDGEKAITHYKVINEFPDFSLVWFKLETGRTHQIRVHSRYIGHPILGDSLYGHFSSLIARQALHAQKICFYHPITNEKVTFIAPLPDDIKKIIDAVN